MSWNVLLFTVQYTLVLPLEPLFKKIYFIYVCDYRTVAGITVTCPTGLLSFHSFAAPTNSSRICITE